MISASATTELHLLNMLIGLCRPCRRWPHTLRDLGYDIFRIELPFTNQDGDQVRPDVILHCANRNHALVVECKSGSYVKPNQIQHYPRVTGHDLVSKAMMPAGTDGTLGRDIMVFCLHSKLPTIRIDLEDSGWAEPVVGVGEDAIRLDLNEFSDGVVNAALRTGIPIRQGDRPPVHFMPFSTNGSVSSDADVARSVLPVIVSMSRRGLRRFTVVDLVTELAGEVLSVLSEAEQQQLRSRVRQILSQAINTDLKHLVRLVRDASEVTWEILFGKFRSELGTYRHLAQRAERFVRRLEENQPYEPSGFIQLDLEDWEEELSRRQQSESHRKKKRSGSGT